MIPLPINYGVSVGDIKFGITTPTEARAYMESVGLKFKGAIISMGMVDTFSSGTDTVLVTYEGGDGSDTEVPTAHMVSWLLQAAVLTDDLGRRIPASKSTLHQFFGDDFRRSDIPGTCIWIASEASLAFDFGTPVFNIGDGHGDILAIKTSAAGKGYFDDV